MRHKHPGAVPPPPGPPGLLQRLLLEDKAGPLQRQLVARSTGAPIIGAPLRFPVASRNTSPVSWTYDQPRTSRPPGRSDGPRPNVGALRPLRLDGPCGPRRGRDQGRTPPLWRCLADDRPLHWRLEHLLLLDQPRQEEHLPRPQEAGGPRPLPAPRREGRGRDGELQD